MKRICYVMLLCLSFFLLSGCSNNDAKTKLKEALLKLEDTDTLSVKMKLEMSMGEIKIPSDMTLQYANGDVSFIYEMNMFGLYAFHISYYAITEDSDNYLYMCLDATGEENVCYYTIIDNWKELVESEEIEEKSLDIESLLDAIIKVEEVDTDKSGYTKLEVTIQRDELISYIKNQAGDEWPETDSTKIEEMPLEFSFDVYLKDGELAIVYIDFTPYLDSSELEDLTSYVLTIEITGRNENIQIEVPQEIKDSAQELSKEEFAQLKETLISKEEE